MFQPSYLHFKPESGWSGFGGVSPQQRDQFRLDPFRMRQLNELRLPPLPEAFKPSNFRPFNESRS